MSSICGSRDRSVSLVLIRLNFVKSLSQMLGYISFTLGLPNVKNLTQFTAPGVSLLTLAVFYIMQFNFQGRLNLALLLDS